MSTRDNILKSVSPTEIVDLEPFGLEGTVLVTGLTSGELDEMENRFTVDGAVQVGVRAFVTTCAAMDPETKQRMFTDEDIGALNAAGGMIINAIFQKAMELSKINEDTIKLMSGN